MTPRISQRFGANRTVAFGMSSVAVGLLMLRYLSPHTPYLYLLFSFVPFISGMALSMSPMTAAIMSAVPSRRAGAGSAMNDATRELGAALGIAVMGSVAATQYTSHLRHVTASLPAATRHAAQTSLADALDAANKLPKGAGHALTVGAQSAFIDGIHLAVIAGAILAGLAALIVLRNLPRQLSGASMHGPAESVEDTAELGLAGVEPVFADGSYQQSGPAPQIALE
jgi:Na+/melibiose symporter-like transporter